MNRTRWRRSLLLLVTLALLAAACSSGSSDETTTTSRVTTTVDNPENGPDQPSVFRVGLTGPITTSNWFAALDGPASTETNQAVLTNGKLSLFAASLPGFVLVPRLAATAEPVEPSQEGDSWIVEQPIRTDVMWSDGTPLTADDLVFYFETVRALELGTDHENHFRSVVEEITAPDPHTVRIVFNAQPRLADWQVGVAVTPFVPAHYWSVLVEQAWAVGFEVANQITPARATQAIVAESLADDDQSNDISAESVTEAQIDAYISDARSAAARAHLYDVDALDEPSIGPVTLEEGGPDGVVIGRPNESYIFAGAESTLYSDGSFRVASATGGTDEVYGGTGGGDVIDAYLEGPFFDEIEWVPGVSRQDAYEKLARGEVDFVLDPTGLTTGLRDELARDADLRFSVSQAEGFRYMAFNLRKPPMSDVSFRAALATVMDKELLIESVLDDEVIPAYTLIHPGVTASYNPDVTRHGWAGGEPMSDDERLVAAVELLTEAGYTWAREPTVEYDEDGEMVGVTPGEGLTMPNGDRVPELLLLAPGPDYDPYRATFAQWVSTWAAGLGVEVLVEETELDDIIERTFPPQTPDSALAWDMYMLGWGAPDPLLPGATLRAFFHSDQDAVIYGGFNTPGYSSDEFDAVADEFDAATTFAEASRLTKEMESILADDLPYIVLFRTPVIEAFRSTVRYPVESIMGGHGAYPNAWPGAATPVE